MTFLFDPFDRLWNVLADWLFPPGWLQTATWREYP